MIRIMKASAGSGKTYNLAKTYISLLLKNKDRYAYRHILAVTFTNKATEEMKTRILKELHILASSPSESDFHDAFVPSLFPDDAAVSAKASAVLRDILHDYSAFAVSTIDRFFQQTLKAFSREIGQFASYQVELDRDSLVAESVDRILDSLTEDDKAMLSWLTDNVLEQIEQGGRYSADANLMKLAVRLQSAQRQEELRKAGVGGDGSYSQDELNLIRKTCRQIMSDFREEVRKRASAAYDVFIAAGVDPKETYRGFMKVLPSYAELDERDALAPPTAAFLNRAKDHDAWFSAKGAALHAKVYPALEAPLQDFCSLWDKDYKVYSTCDILDSQIYGLGVARELSATFKELMKEKNVLCIDDSNTILRGIIDGSDAPFIYEKIGVRFDHFLLDEFQDTSSVQWTNFSPLLHNSDAQGGENLVVGDVKQSIYRWRGSDWNLLDSQVPEEFPEYVQEVLDTNYRSLANVVEFNNAYFKAAAEILDSMNGEEGNGRHSVIYADVEQKTARKSKEKGSVSLTFCDKEKELDHVLQSVHEAQSAGARLSEIAVLVRSNAIGESVARHLIENGITVITDDSLKVKSAMTVRRLVSLMSYIDNPENTVNGFLAESLDIRIPEGYTSLTDMAEYVIREMKKNDSDEVFAGEVLHIQSFMDHLQEFVASNGNNLRGFLKYWEEEDPSISSPSSGESVRVMTIHKSKGLDFPYVIIPYAENISLFKADSRWCAPELSGTPLEGVAEGVYDVVLSRSSESTLFSEHYKTENFLQQVDNINTIYVAMTRAASGMHVIARKPAQKCLDSVERNEAFAFTDFSQILYWFAAASGKLEGVRKSAWEDMVRFDFGDIVDFNSVRKAASAEVMSFPSYGNDSYPSFPLNPETGDLRADVRERGRLKFSADSLDFFATDGSAGISASNRIRGVVLHDILAKVVVADDLDQAVADALASGEISSDEQPEVEELLSRRIEEGVARGWFPDDPDKVLNETSLIDSDGQIYRPDRVVMNGSDVIVIDYKFGEHHRKYERQMAGYADIWKRMGYENVSAVLWYVQTGECVIL